MKIALRWIAVLPGALIAAILFHFSVHYSITFIYEKCFPYQILLPVYKYLMTVTDFSVPPFALVTAAAHIAPAFKRQVGFLFIALLLISLPIYFIIYYRSGLEVDYIRCCSFITACIYSLKTINSSYPKITSLKNRVRNQIHLYYNPIWMYDRTLATLFMCEIPKNYIPKTPEDLEPYQEARLMELIEQALKDRNPVAKDLEDKLNIQICSNDPLHIAREIMQGDNWLTYSSRSEYSYPKEQPISLDRDEQEYIFRTTSLYHLIEQLQISL